MTPQTERRGDKAGAGRSPRLPLQRCIQAQDEMKCGPCSAVVANEPPISITRGVAHQTRRFSFADHLSDAERVDWMCAWAIDRARGLG
jgi:hypothetical protein